MFNNSVISNHLICKKNKSTGEINWHGNINFICLKITCRIKNDDKDLNNTKYANRQFNYHEIITFPCKELKFEGKAICDVDEKNHTTGLKYLRKCGGIFILLKFHNCSLKILLK